MNDEMSALLSDPELLSDSESNSKENVPEPTTKKAVKPTAAASGSARVPAAAKSAQTALVLSEIEDMLSD